MAFYDRFINLCNKKEDENGTPFSPSKAAEEMGFHRCDVTRWKNGAVPRDASLHKIAAYFGVEFDDVKYSGIGKNIVKAAGSEKNAKRTLASLFIRKSDIESMLCGDYSFSKEVVQQIAEALGVSVDAINCCKKNPDLKNEIGINPQYYELDTKNRAFIDSMIAELLKSQSQD